MSGVTGTLHAFEFPDWISENTRVGNFYFYWADASETTFAPGRMAVMEENIYSFTVKHAEGQVPTLEIIIKNPRIGLLNPGRKLWGWLSWQQAEGVIVPLFFGVLVGIPNNIFAELVTLQFNARAVDWIERKQTVAETLKVAPFYDPIFLDETHRDNPDSILEGYSSLYHSDRTSLNVSVSDILQGEDGTVQFTEDKVLYDSVDLTMGECPLNTVQVQANVKWTQRNIGKVQGPTVSIASYTGDTFASDWPKPGAGLGGGWRVESSYVDDVYLVALTPMANVSSTYTNKDPTAGDCAIQSTSSQASWPALKSPNSIGGTLTWFDQTGLCDPDGYASAEAIDANTPGVNIPAKIHATGKIVPAWYLICEWFLRYDAKRTYNELLIMDVQAHLQQTLTSPLVTQDTHVIKATGADVGMPLQTFDAWTDFAGKPVSVGETIFPNDPNTVGGLSYQICVQSGIAGTVEPPFSDVPGTLTNDNTVVWASLGETPGTAFTTWADAMPVPYGEIIVYQPSVFSNDSGQFETIGASAFYLCIGSGETNSAQETFSYTPTILSNTESTPEPIVVPWTRQPGQTSPYSYFLAPAGSQVFDGSVTWLSLGQAPDFLSIPIGGVMENVTANNYFSGARGQQSIQYLICKARALLRHRSRAVTIKFDTQFANVVNLSCRMNATVFDYRIPGKQATGKIIEYEMHVDKDGKMLGHVEIGCAVGFGNTVTEVEGTPVYALNGYMQDGYQQETGETTVVNTGQADIMYTPPVYNPYDDGLIFPLRTFPGTVTITGSLAEQIAPIESGLAVDKKIANFQMSSPFLASGSDAAVWAIENMQRQWQGTSLEYRMQENPVAAEVLIDSVTNGPFYGSYQITCSPLEVPMGINLGAPSSP